MNPRRQSHGALRLVAPFLLSRYRLLPIAQASDRKNASTALAAVLIYATPLWALRTVRGAVLDIRDRAVRVPLHEIITDVTSNGSALGVG